jgi:hypothetical protein
MKKGLVDFESHNLQIIGGNRHGTVVKGLVYMHIELCKVPGSNPRLGQK